MDPLYPGRIIWHAAPGPRGLGKSRPMVLASRRADILRGMPIVAVVCSTDFQEPPGPGEILLPSAPDGRCTTRLRSRTVAVCDWLVTIRAAEIERTGGFVPSALLREICLKAGIPVPNER